ncbi:alpha-ketoglutarate-dependent dioxygenase alkB homolog 4-like [Rhopilema esculentum]|uniref:alpha-ketoglutarate-dependent dioxygenase alkB homolog 4-like n=1 Tax=Rhopilema esculentum TaxID=499914 RepID=UPI0031D1D7E4|eukprot:gene15440-6688_t
MAERKCGCSGIRMCLICEEKRGKIYDDLANHAFESTNLHFLHFCMNSKNILCGPWKFCSCKNGRLHNGDNDMNFYEHTTADIVNSLSVYIDADHKHDKLQQFLKIFNGLLGSQDITVIENYVTDEEESFMINEMYKMPWKLSQSGRRKQDFGPQVNFKRRKLKVGSFTGFPFFLKDVVLKMKTFKELDNFDPVEVCHLEYSSERGSAIDPHIDDTWLWGERLVTLSLLSSSILTLQNDEFPEIAIQIPMPRCSLLVLQGQARNNWKHSVRREDISNKRIAVTFRELSENFSKGSQHIIGEEVLKVANNFNGKPLFEDKE